MHVLSSISRRQTRKTLTGLVLALPLLLSACDPLNGVSEFLDCVDDDGPVLSPRELPIPVLNQSYEAVITASIENEPRDDNFTYTFTIGAGLPAGLIVDVFNRDIRISGAPTQLGSFAVRVEVLVEDLAGEEVSSRLCRSRTARNFVFTVQQGF